MDRAEVGSYTAKGGFKNELDICNRFNNYKVDVLVHNWLTIMGYPIDKIDDLQAVHIPTAIKKTDVNTSNISCKIFEVNK